MSAVEELSSGKGHRDENFPVASVLIHPNLRPPVLAFYRFARAADDVADHPTAAQDEKIRLLEAMEQSLLGRSAESQEAQALRSVLRERGLTDRHALDLLVAFRRDVTKTRYENWDELMDYCRYSAMPVGRFVLDVHGESDALWPANDALCAALQVINHLQDCGKDYRQLNRVYLPYDAMQEAGMKIEALGAGRADAAVLVVIRTLARRTAELLALSRSFSRQIHDRRLSLEVGVIQSLAEDLNVKLLERDPLSERVHHTRSEVLGVVARAGARFAAGRLGFRLR
jgi:squalene synthase HpnC